MIITWDGFWLITRQLSFVECERGANIFQYMMNSRKIILEILISKEIILRPEKILSTLSLSLSLIDFYAYH